MAPREDRNFQIALCSIALPLPIILIRLWSKYISQKGRYTADDWLALAAWLCGLGVSICPLIGPTKYVGLSSSKIPQPVLEQLLETVYASDLLYHMGIGCSKLSALALYYRLFGLANRRFISAMRVAAVGVVAYVLFAESTIIWQCSPISKFWDQKQPGHCLDIKLTYLLHGIFDFTLDLLILFLPMPVLFRLRMTITRKVLLIAAFACGYCTLIVSIGHFVVLIRFLRAVNVADITRTCMQLGLWTMVEIPVTVISICLPSCFWFYKRAKAHGLSSLFTTRDKFVLSSPQHSPCRPVRLQDPALDDDDGNLPQKKAQAFGEADDVDLEKGITLVEYNSGEIVFVEDAQVRS